MANARLTERQKRVFLIALLVALGIVFAVNWAGRRKADLYGPTVLAQASDERIWLVLNHELFVLEPDGAIVLRVPVKAIGIASPVAALAPLADGAMLIGSRTSGLLHEVDSKGVQRREIDPSASGKGRLFGAFHLLPLPNSDDLVVADTSNHRLLLMGRDGGVRQAYGSSNGQPGPLHFPNGLALDEQGRVLVVDTNHNTVRAFTATLEPVTDRDFSARADRGYVWPALIATAPEGIKFISVMASGMERGRVFKWSRNGARLRELEMPPNADPAGLLVRKIDVLVSDQFNLAVHRFDLEGAALGQFADASLKPVYGEIRNLRRIYAWTVRGGQLLLVVMLAALLVLLVRERKAQEKLGATLAVQALEYARPSRLRLGSYAFWLVWRVSFLLIALNVLANMVLWHASSRTRPTVAGFVDDLIVFLCALIPTAIAVWHFDRMLRAGKYSDIVSFGAQSLLRRLGSNLQGLLLPGETIEHLAIGSSGGRVQLLALTPQRLLVLTLSASLRDITSAQELRRDAVTRATVEVPKVPFLFRLVGKIGSARLQIEGGGNRYVFPVFEPASAAAMAEALSSGDKTAAAGAAQLREVTGEGAPPKTARRSTVAVPVMLSALLPGLGQLAQERLMAGAVALLCVAIWMAQMLEPLIAMVRKTTAVNPDLPIIALTGYLFIWTISLVDTYLAAKQNRDINHETSHVRP